MRTKGRSFAAGTLGTLATPSGHILVEAGPKIVILKLHAGFEGPQVGSEGTRMCHLKQPIPKGGGDDQSGSVVIDLHHDTIF